MLSVSSTVKLSSSLTSISLASPTEKSSIQNQQFWYSLDGDEGYALATVGGASSASESRGAYYALVKNPEKCVQYQQAQQQTEDRSSSDEEDNEDDSSEKIIHL